MKTENLTLILDWLKNNNAHSEGGIIPIPKKIRSDVIEIVGVNESFKDELLKNRIPKNFLYQRIMINKEFAFNLDEKFWWEQFQLVQRQKIYFNNIKQKELDPDEPAAIQIQDKAKASEKIEYLEDLAASLELKMKKSDLWMNHLTYLLG